MEDQVVGDQFDLPEYEQLEHLLNETLFDLVQTLASVHVNNLEDARTSIRSTEIRLHDARRLLDRLLNE